nr:integrase, catalytic region, zinc finger, CCHC-type, peptidase aspartic, catalytic [Tanacetum cinerariifolium]
MARQCPKPKRKRDATWFRKKVLLVEAQGNGKVLNEEELEFLADSAIAEGPVTQLVITHNVAYQVDDLDVYDFDCDEISRAKAVLMANLSSYGLVVLSEVPISENTNNDMLNQRVQEMSYFEPSLFMEHAENEIHSDKEEWGFKHTKADFQNEIIPFLKTLKDIFNVFDKDLLNELTKVQTVLNQMEAAVQQYHVDKQCFEIQKKHFLIENDRLMDQIISQDIMNIVVNSSVDVNNSMKVNSSVVMNDSVNYVEMCNKFLELKTELIKQHNMVEKDEYNRLSKRFSKLKQHSELQAKDTTIKKLETHIKHINETSTSESVKKDFDEIETINIELEHRVTRLIAENEHLKQTYKQLYDSIKPSRVRAKEQSKSLVNQTSNAATISPGMYKLDQVILAPKVKNNREAHEYYLQHTMEQAAILRERKERKPTGKVFNSVRYKWKPTGRTFTLVGNVCPLTRLTATKKVPLRVAIHIEVVSPKHVVTRVYTRRPKVHESVQNSKPMVVKSMTATRMEPDTSRGSDTSVVPSSTSLIDFSKKQSHKPKSEDTNQEKLYLLYMDLYGPMRVTSVNGKKYILIIVDDYSRFTWVKFLASKDEAPDFIIKFLKMIQVRLNATVKNIRTDNRTEFVNQTLRDYYEQVGIYHETSVA